MRCEKKKNCLRTGLTHLDLGKYLSFKIVEYNLILLTDAIILIFNVYILKFITLEEYAK